MLKLFKCNWENVIVGVLYVDDLWQVNIVLNQVLGYLLWVLGGGYNGVGVLNVWFVKLVVLQSLQYDFVGCVMNLLMLIDWLMLLIDLIVDQVVVCDYDIGWFVVNVCNIDEDGMLVWQFDKLELLNLVVKFMVIGNWCILCCVLVCGVDENDVLCWIVFDFKFDIDNVGVLFDCVGLLCMFVDGYGLVMGKVGWCGGLIVFDFLLFGGQVVFDFEYGQILKVDLGVVKFFGVLSLQSFVCFLMLNFCDVVGKGLLFDKIIGIG